MRKETEMGNEEDELNEMLKTPDKLLDHIADLIEHGDTDQWSSDMLHEMASDWRKGKYRKQEILDDIDNHIIELQLKWGELANIILNNIRAYIKIKKCPFGDYGSNYSCLSCEIRDTCRILYETRKIKTNKVGD
jgi:hypothetical protein